MTIDGDVLEIELDMELDDVMELKEFVMPRLEYIEEIAIVGDQNEFSSSSLFQLLISIKKTKPSMKIPLIDQGFFEMGNFGKLNWMQ